MRKSKIVTLEGRGEVTVKEVTPLAVLHAIQSGDVAGECRALLADAVDYEGNLLELYPSELHIVIDALLEVNAAFFKIAERLRLSGIIGDVLGVFGEQMRKTLPEAFAASYGTAMARLSATSGGASS